MAQRLNSDYTGKQFAAAYATLRAMGVASRTKIKHALYPTVECANEDMARADCHPRKMD